MKQIQQFILRLIGLGDLDARLKDLERHFVTKRDDKGSPIQTLADVPVKDRKEFKPSLKGMNWAQRKAYLEATDGGRFIPNSQPTSSTAR